MKGILVSENCGISILDKNYSLYRENISVLEIEDKCETQVYLATLKKQSLSPVANELKSFILKQKNVFTGYNEIE